MYKPLVLSFFLLITLLILNGCDSSKSYDQEMNIVTSYASQYIDKTIDEPILFEESSDKTYLYINVFVKEEYSELNKRKKWEEIENVAVAMSVDKIAKANNRYKDIFIFFYNSETNLNMNVFGERKMDFNSLDYNRWMTQYYDTSGNAVYYPSYYDSEAQI